MIGGNAPSSYLSMLQTHEQVQLGDEQMNSILGSHYIDPITLRDNDFSAFISNRKAALVKLVERAMGKTAAASNSDSSRSDLVAESDDSLL